MNTYGLEQYFTLGRIQKIAKQCLIALEFIHKSGIIHCDLKPENILIENYEQYIDDSFFFLSLDVRSRLWTLEGVTLRQVPLFLLIFRVVLIELQKYISVSSFHSRSFWVFLMIIELICGLWVVSYVNFIMVYDSFFLVTFRSCLV